LVTLPDTNLGFSVVVVVVVRLDGGGAKIQRTIYTSVKSDAICLYESYM